MANPPCDLLTEGLRDPAAYPHPVAEPVEVIETHISRIFLAGRFAYKTKKPVVTEFLDYGTLEARREACHEELRLNLRYAAELYLQVVPISLVAGRPHIGEGIGVGGGEGCEAIEYAVKMHRFPAEALLRERLRRGAVSGEEVHQLAETLAAFHSAAAVADGSSPWGSPERIRADAMANFHDLRTAGIEAIGRPLAALQQWSGSFIDAAEDHFRQRVAEGFVRECHGDLHLSNVIRWHERLIPFDGIEFNEGFRWIDVLSDAAFLAMDFAACGHRELGRGFTSEYLECTGDYGSLRLWRWYLVYRALVRAKVAAIRAGQEGADEATRVAAAEDCRSHVALAERFITPEPPRLWITHGFSGSGKTTGSQRVIHGHDAIRIRSDVERKRVRGWAPETRPSQRERDTMYAETGRRETYDRLHGLAAQILRGGYSVVVDATFLEFEERQRFRELADSESARFAILDFPVDEATLRQRIAARVAENRDASDAGIEVLEHQLATAHPLTAEEQRDVEKVA